MAEREVPLTSDPPGCQLDRTEMSVARAAFGALLTGRQPDGVEVARASGLDAGTVEDAIGSLVGKGQMVVDGRGQIVGSTGLSRVPTPHRIGLGEAEVHVWCAIDAVGIASAVGTDAVVRTRCPTCGGRIEVQIRPRRGIDAGTVVAWVPASDACGSVIDEACPHMNLFCREEHLQEWRRQMGDPPGGALALSEISARGREQWRDLVGRSPRGRADLSARRG